MADYSPTNYVIGDSGGVIAEGVQGAGGAGGPNGNTAFQNLNPPVQYKNKEYPTPPGQVNRGLEPQKSQRIEWSVSQLYQVETIDEVRNIAASIDQADTKAIFCKVWPVTLGMFIVIFGSIFLLPFYTYIPGSESLPQILFYTKLFSDTLSRPLTMFVPKPKNKYFFLFCTMLRLCTFLPFFFLYMGHDLGFKNDIVIIITVSIFSMTSGFLGTTAYQIAPRLCGNSSVAKAEAANMITLAFNFACVFSLVIAFVVVHSVPFFKDQ